MVWTVEYYMDSGGREPVADFIDLFVLGEAEEAIVELANLVKLEKKNGTAKKDILLKAARKFSWAYVPCFYKFEYDNSKIKSFAGQFISVVTSVADVEDAIKRCYSGIFSLHIINMSTNI